MFYIYIHTLKTYGGVRAEVPLQSWLAVVHELTPSEVEMMRSLSNRQPLLRNRFWCFLNQLHTEIQAQKINSNVYKVTELIFKCHGIAATENYKETNDRWHMPKVPKRKIATQDKAPISKFRILKFLKQQR